MGSFKKYEEEKACPERNAMDFLVNPPFDWDDALKGFVWDTLLLTCLVVWSLGLVKDTIIGFSRCLKFDYLKIRSRFPESQKQFKGSLAVLHIRNIIILGGNQIASLGFHLAPALLLGFGTFVFSLLHQ